jgi:hypothetical protein
MYFLLTLVLRGRSPGNLEFGYEMNKVWPIIIPTKNTIF